MSNHPSRFLVFAFPLLLGLSAAAQEAPGDHPTGRTVTLGEMTMYYEVAGSGEPLLLLHSGTQSGRMWDPFIPELASRYRLIIPDLRGHGGSTNPDGVLSTRQFAADVFALLYRLEVERCKAIGASAGAMTLLRMAIDHPDLIDAMVVIGAGTGLPSECRTTLAQTDADALSEAAWDALRARHRHGDAQIRALYDWVASLAESSSDMRLEPEELATITASTLIVHGDRDYCFPASMAWDIYQAIPKAYLWVVPNGSHVPLAGTNADAFTRTVMDFFAGAWQSR